jgi:subtilisin family serine protease
MAKDGKRAADEVDETLYSVTKIGLSAAHAVASGLGVKVAVIDSGVDARHSELRGSVLKAFDATRGRGQKDETHGTAIAGIIRAKDGRARGVAPGAELLSATAFFKETGQAGAFSSTMILLRALNWSVLSGARIINMSFAGPQDAKLADAVTAAAGRGVILVAAAGNNGPRAEPAYPAAYANVIAVTATDIDDELYENANRGSYVAVAAPGVDVLVLKPAAGHAFSSGTSMAAAHVSGLIALMLERNGKLGFEDVRAALTRTARDLGERGIDTKFGAGRVDAAALIQSVPLPEGPAVSLAKQDR